MSFEKVQKSFGSTMVLTDVTLQLFPGEVHALVGENGAGKSTLMNILAGVLSKDAGVLRIAGNEYNFVSTHDARSKGIATVFQELSLIEGLSVEENICAGRPPTRYGLVDKKNMRKRAIDALAHLNSKIHAGTQISRMSASHRQIVEIAKAFDQLFHDTNQAVARILILDEPTSALTADEKNHLFSAINKLKAQGIGIFYISHHLEEVMSIADRVTVLRDGAVVWTRLAQDVTVDELVLGMVGRNVERTTRYRAITGDIAARFVDISLSDKIKNLSFNLNSGEILAVAGLDGSGREHVARILAGIEKPDSGEVELFGKSHPQNLIAAIKRGIGYVPDDRKSAGLFLDLSLASNVLAADLNSISQNGFVNERALLHEGYRTIKRHNVKAVDPLQAVSDLSGGNQQKILFAKWFRRNPSLLVIEEPTKGVDVGSKKEIHDEIVSLARKGAAVLVVSSDLPEILELADRILVLHRGSQRGIVDGANATEASIMRLAAGSNSTVHE